MSKTSPGRFKTLILIFVFLLSYSSSAETIDYGLAFHSHEVNQDRRTSLNLSPNSPFRLNDGFVLSFDMMLYEHPKANYGYVFRIVSGRNASLDMVANVHADRFGFILSDEHKVTEKISVHKSPDTEAGLWCNVEVRVEKDRSVVCKINGAEYKFTQKIKTLKDIDIRFGWSDHHVYYTTDVAPMSLRNVRISSGDEILYDWPLYQHNITEVYDEVNRETAAVKDGNWIIDRHSQWKTEQSLKTATGVPMLAYDQSTERLFVATADSVHICWLSDGTLVSEKVLKGTPIRNSGNQMVYDPVSDRLVCFSMHNESIAEYKIGSRRWVGSFREEWPPMTGHSHIYDCDSSRIYVFGGYGNHKYIADYTQIDLSTGKRTTTDLSDQLWPRYLSAMGRDSNGDLIVMGGFGNASGYQEESPSTLNDIVRIDPETLKAESIGTFIGGEEPVVFASSLLCDKNRIYSLVFNNSKYRTSLRLAALDREDNASLMMYADPIEYVFRDTDSYATLLFNRDSTRLYSVVLSSVGRGVNLIHVSSLSYPPLLPEEIIQISPRSFSVISVLIAVALCLLGLGIYILPKTYRKRKVWKMIRETDHSFKVSLLGGFRLTDAEGNDITSKLTSLPRQILIYFILRFMGRKSKVTSAEFNDIFWPGMDRAQIINNRNVNIRKLRVVLEEVGDIQLIYNNDTWSLQLGEEVPCDYCLILPLLKRASQGDDLNLEEVSMILSSLSKGTLLTGYEYEWMDKYKAAYSDLVVSAMMKISRYPYIASENGLLLRVADIIMTEDSIDEFAIRTKCRVLYQTGQTGKSKQVYNQYLLEYKRLLDSEPKVSYQEIIQ